MTTTTTTQPSSILSAPWATGRLRALTGTAVEPEDDRRAYGDLVTHVLVIEDDPAIRARSCDRSRAAVTR